MERRLRVHYLYSYYPHLCFDFSIIGVQADDVLEEWYFNMVSMMPVDDGVNDTTAC